MRTIETNVFTFDELDEQAKTRAINDFRERDGYPENDWSDFTIEDAKTLGATIGFTIDAVSFSGFWSQGDGASFTGEYRYSPGWRKKLADYAPQEKEVVSIGERLAAAQRRRFYGLTARIKAAGRYYHSGTMSADVETADGREATDDDSRELLDCARDFAGWIYSRLEQEYEYLTGDESISETIRANEYEFTATGKMA